MYRAPLRSQSPDTVSPYTTLFRALKALGRVGERNIAEVRGVMRDFFHDRDAREAVSREELAERLNAGQVTVLDVRPEAEYALGHVAGAINIPADELEQIGRAHV